VKRYPIRLSQVEGALHPTAWSLTNEILYKLCRNHPAHTDKQVILAKVNIVGRVYAAAIERRRRVAPGTTGDNFYFDHVVPNILKSNLDEWIAKATTVDPQNENSIPALLEVHKKTTELFNRISGQNKRSLASKYLHFHVPQLFFIYDSRTLQAIRKLRVVIGNERSPMFLADKDYRFERSSDWSCPHVS
jgi:hypothetical protein